MQCQLCRREMASADPIYRVSVAYSMNTCEISHGGVFEVCAECCSTKPMISQCFRDARRGLLMPRHLSVAAA